MLSKAAGGCGGGDLLLRCAIEGVGTALLLAVAIATVILPERFWASDWMRFHSVSIACGLSLAGFYAIGRRLGGELFNPALSLAAVLRGALPLHRGIAYAAAQLAGAFFGVIVTQAVLNLDAVQQPLEGTISFGAIAAELVVTFVFVFVIGIADGGVRPTFTAAWIHLSLRERLDRFAVREGGKQPMRGVETPPPRPLAVGEGVPLRLGGIYFTHGDTILGAATVGLTFVAINALTPLMSFANPAATIARTLTSNALLLSASQAAWAVAAQLFGATAAAVMLPRRVELPIAL